MPHTWELDADLREEGDERVADELDDGVSQQTPAVRVRVRVLLHRRVVPTTQQTVFETSSGSNTGKHQKKSEQETP